MAPDTIEVIAPNLKRRLSGVTATIERLVPLQAKTMGVVATGAGLSPAVPFLPISKVFLLPRRKRRVWHARRNTEMLLGLFLRTVLRKNFVLLFTSASQRQHSGYTRWLISKMDRIIATSAKGQAYLTVPSTVVHHGIDIDRFAPPADRSELRRSLGLPDGAVLIGCYGRIRHQKGTDAFIDAMITVAADHPSVHGVIMGRATEKHQGFLSEQLRKVEDAGLSDRIRVYPEVNVNEMADWYGALDVYVAPQRWEGFGLTVLEALACGVPVIATDVGAFSEMIEEGANGYLVPAGDPGVISLTAAALLDDPELLGQLRGRARASILQSFDIKREADDLIGIYRALLESSD